MNNNDLIELQNYMKNKFNLDVNVKLFNKKNISNIKSINTVYIHIFIIIILTVLFILFIKFLLKNKVFNLFKKKYLIFNITYYILFIFIILCIIYYLQKYLFMIYFYYKNNNIYEDECINVDNIYFNTGDILQEVSNWNYPHGYLLYLSQFDFLHNIFVFKFNNTDYILHYVQDSTSYPENILLFKNKHLEVGRLKDYLKDNKFCTKYYRLFKNNKKIDTDKIFTFLNKLNIEDLQFSYKPCLKNCDYDNKFNCMSFILKLLNSLNIIPKFNINNFTSNDLVYLNSLSNNAYDKPFIIKV
jgi:hypothetical protein